LTANIAAFLNPDQLKKLKCLPGSKGRGITWSSETIQRCLAIRTIVGRNGYEYLRSLKFPLPSYRTLCRQIQSAPFSPGVQHDVLQWLRLKMESKSDADKLCVLLFDEMQLKAHVEMDQGLRRVVGYVSPELQPTSDKELATHAMVFMLRGLTSSWKQTVAYLFTGASTKREPLWNFAKQVISVSEAAGFRIQAVISDMGPTNTGLWNHVGIESSRKTISPTIEHPCSADRLLYFMADPPHLLKNLWNCVLTHRITLGPDTVKRYRLPSDVVWGVYVGQLLFAQHERDLRMAYKLRMFHVNPTQYQKMRVCYAAQFFSMSTASAIQTAVMFNELPVEALTTAWFLSLVNKWFDGMNARHKDTALLNGKATEGRRAMQAMLEVIKDMTFSGKTVWKPIQTGIQLSTTVALELGSKVMSEHQLPYFLTGRLSQDPVENLFSQARGRGIMHPSCAVFRQTLRLVTIAQYLQVAKGAAYEEDGCTYLVDYLKEKATGSTHVDENSLLPALLDASAEMEAEDMLQDAGQMVGTEAESSVVARMKDLVLEAWQKSNDIGCFDLQTDLLEDSDEGEVSLDSSGSKEQVEVDDLGAIETVSDFGRSRQPLHSLENVAEQEPLNHLEGNALYDIVGWAASKVVAKTPCDVCRSAFVADASSDKNLGLYTSIRSYGGLTHPSKELLAAAKVAEQVFTANKPSIRLIENLDLEITRQVLDAVSQVFTFPDCHNALQKIMKKYVRLRINIHASTANIKHGDSAMNRRQYGSKTALRSTLIP
jgi:hypothetical protein